MARLDSGLGVKSGGAGVATRLEGYAKGAALIAAGVGLVAVNAVAARKLLSLSPHVKHTSSGLARVCTVHDAEGERVRVLNVGGAYQSATYFRNRWHEPVFEYQRAFDHMFEAEESLVDVPLDGAVVLADETANGGAASSEPVTAADSAASSAGACGATAGDAASGPAATDDAPLPFRIHDVLMIGGGGCAWPKHAIMTRPDLHVDVVEADPSIAEIARRYFFVDKLERTLRENEGTSERFNLIIDDGLGYLAGTDARYDVIVNDAFAGKVAAGDLACETGIRAVKDHLREGGLYMVNAVSDSRWREFRHVINLINELDRAFAHVWVLFSSDEEFSDKDNYLIIASDGDYRFTDEIAYEDIEG